MARLRRKCGKAVFQRGGFSGSVYRGKIPRRTHQGAGLMSMLKFIPKLGGPLVKGIASKFMRKVPQVALKTGVSIMSDIAKGKKFKQAVKTRGKTLGNQALNIVRQAAVQSISKKKVKKRKGVTKKKGKRKQKGAGKIRTVVQTKYVRRGKTQNVFGD